MHKVCRNAVLSLLVLSASADFEVSLLVTSEIRGAVYPVYTSGATCHKYPGASIRGLCCSGGAARRRTIFDAGAASLKIDLGSYYTGSGKFFPAFNGTASAEFFGAAGYDGFGLTFRDFTQGPEWLASTVALARSIDAGLPKATVSNYDISGDPLLGAVIAPYTLVDLAGGKKLALLSLTNPTHLHSTQPATARRFQPFLQSLLATLAAVRRTSPVPAVIVCIVSDMVVSESELAAHGSRDAAVNASFAELVSLAIGVDAFILGAFDYPPAADAVPHLRPNWAGDPVLIVPALAEVGGTTMLSVTLKLTDDGVLLSTSTASTVALDSTVTEHAATATRLDELWDEMDSRLGATIHTLSHALNSTPTVQVVDASQLLTSFEPSHCVNYTDGMHACGCRVSSCRQGAFVSDALAEMTGADFGIVNAGSIANSILAGAVTSGDVFAMLPFTDYIHILSISGAA